MRLKVGYFLLAVAFLGGGEAGAGDGVLEISQACAENVGCFSGDSPGWPVSINGSAGYSYVLTGDLNVPDENTTAIRVSADGVRIDLGGFRILGPVSCTGTPPVCNTSGTGVGIDAGGITPRNELLVSNGTIRGMGDLGIEANSRSRVERVNFRSNAAGGVSLATGGQVVDCIAGLNGGNFGAIVIGDHGMARGNTAINNLAAGISVGDGGLVIDNVAGSNSLRGIHTGEGATVTGNTARQNGDRGILTGAYSMIADNSALANENVGIDAGSGTTVVGNVAGFNGENGISLAFGSTAQRNVMRDNGQGGSGHGLRALNTSTYGNNVMTDNATGGVSGGGVNLGGNFCAGTGVAMSTCP